MSLVTVTTGIVLPIHSVHGTIEIVTTTVRCVFHGVIKVKQGETLVAGNFTLKLAV